ncbi:MAG: type III secretion system chaperone [Chitinophagaceae bacterium]|nr:type III secretion system chaperone [Rubrivivax sp.]
MTDTATSALIAELARCLGVDTLPEANDGAIALAVGDDVTVRLYPLTTDLMAVVPLAPLPAQPDPARMTRLLASNHFNAPLAPFVVAADVQANLVLWGRVPMAGITGEQLAGLLGRLGGEARRLREVIGVDDAEGAGST